MNEFIIIKFRLEEFIINKHYIYDIFLNSIFSKTKLFIKTILHIKEFLFSIYLLIKNYPFSSITNNILYYIT